MSLMDDRLRAYRERVAARGEITIAPVLPADDGGTGDRWSALWAPAEDALPDYDASAPTLELAVLYLAYVLAEEVLSLRAQVAEMGDSA